VCASLTLAGHSPAWLAGLGEHGALSTEGIEPLVPSTQANVPCVHVHVACAKRAPHAYATGHVKPSIAHAAPMASWRLIGQTPDGGAGGPDTAFDEQAMAPAKTAETAASATKARRVEDRRERINGPARRCRARWAKARPPTTAPGRAAPSTERATWRRSGS